jgi:hypothetical protein
MTSLKITIKERKDELTRVIWMWRLVFVLFFLFYLVNVFVLLFGLRTKV